MEPERPPSLALNFHVQAGALSLERAPSRSWWELRGGVVSGLFNLESSGVGASENRPTPLTSVTTKANSLQPQNDTVVHLFDNWFDPIEAAGAIVFANSSMPLIEGARHSAVAAALSAPREFADRRSGGGGRRRRSPLRPWVALADRKLRPGAPVANCLEDARDRLFISTRLPFGRELPPGSRRKL